MYKNDIQFISHCLSGRVIEVRKLLDENIVMSNESLLKIYKALKTLVTSPNSKTLYSKKELEDYTKVYQMLLEHTSVLEIERNLKLQESNKTL